MKKQFDKKTLILAAVALAFTATLSVGSALAYFTTFSTASGSVQMNLGFTETTVNDNVENHIKQISVTNSGDYACYVRVKLFSDTPLGNVSGTKWSLSDDGYYYYSDSIASKETTETLAAEIVYPENVSGKETEEFNVIVVQECTPVVYDSNNNPIADWEHAVIKSSND